MKAILIGALCLIGILLPANVWGAEFYGLSAFAAMSKSFPCARYLRTVNESRTPAMAVLWRTFGEDLGCMDRFLDAFAGKSHLLQIHLSNEVCRRNARCFEGELLRGWSVARYNKELEQLTPAVIYAVALRVNSIKARIEPLTNEHTTLALSLGLEDNFTQRAADNLTLIVRQLWPYIIVRNPVPARLRLSALGTADILEAHQESYEFQGLPCLANEDAVGLTVPGSREFLTEYSNCFAIFLWRAEAQGAGRRKWLPPRKRPLSISLTQARDLGNLLKEFSK